MTIQELVEAFINNEPIPTGQGRASSVAVYQDMFGPRLFSYSYPLARRGCDRNGNTTIFLNTGALIEHGGYPGMSRNLAYSKTTQKHRNMVRRAAESACLNVIELDFYDGDAYAEVAA